LDRLKWSRIGLLKVDTEGYERILFRDKCPWLSEVDAMFIECHEGFGEADLERIALAHGFEPPVKLPGIWFLNLK
jgi:hypothetical protein